MDNQRVTWTAFAMFYIWEPSQPIRIKSKFSDHLLLAIFLQIPMCEFRSFMIIHDNQPSIFFAAIFKAGPQRPRPDQTPCPTSPPEPAEPASPRASTTRHKPEEVTTKWATQRRPGSSCAASPITASRAAATWQGRRSSRRLPTSSPRRNSRRLPTRRSSWWLPTSSPSPQTSTTSSALSTLPSVATAGLL